MLPLSDKFSARLPVFTNFPSDRIVLSKADSAMLVDIRELSLAIQKDSFRMAMIEQVDITPQRTFEITPKLGNQLILLGDASAAEEKLQKMELFYKKVMPTAGWNYYSVINLQYKGQVVAKKRGAEDVSADSLRTLQVMQMIALQAQQQASDSLQTMIPDNEHNSVDSTMIQQSMQRDEGNEAPKQADDKVVQPPKVPAPPKRRTG
ncbi:MAG TPA: hypothetical protein VKH37_11245, partial [Ferruginibacter sp.]|nr:hypothetical protein [Ferruginibacter sp.]